MRALVVVAVGAPEGRRAVRQAVLRWLAARVLARAGR